MLDYIGRLLKELLRSLGSALWSFFTEFYDWAFSQLISLIQDALGLVGIDSSFQWATDFWNTLNFFFPVNEGLAMLTVVFAVWSVCYVIKISLKLIPTIY